MVTSRFVIVGLGICALLSVAGSSRAGVVSLYPTPSGTSVGANAYDDADNGVFSYDYVSAFPDTSPVNATDGTSVSTTTPNLSSNALGASFAQSFSDPKSIAGGYFQVYFTVSTTVGYNISGQMSVVGAGVPAVISAKLTDTTSNQVLYDDTETYTNPQFMLLQIPHVLALQNVGQTGSSTGTLVAGDVYFLLVEQGIDTLSNTPAADPTPTGGDPSSTGSIGIAFGPAATAPLPLAAPAALLLLVPLAIVRSKRSSAFQVK